MRISSVKPLNIFPYQTSFPLLQHVSPPTHERSLHSWQAYIYSPQLRPVCLPPSFNSPDIVKYITRTPHTYACKLSMFISSHRVKQPSSSTHASPTTSQLPVTLPTTIPSRNPHNPHIHSQEQRTNYFSSRIVYSATFPLPQPSPRILHTHTPHLIHTSPP
jgi:hypothetical protein